MRNWPRRQQASQSTPEDIQVLNADDLKKNRANDAYRNNKKVADPMFDFIGIAIKLLPYICLFAVGFLVWYYLISSHRDTATVAGVCINILVYVAGIVTSAMNDALKHKDD